MDSAAAGVVSATAKHKHTGMSSRLTALEPIRGISQFGTFLGFTQQGFDMGFPPPDVLPF